MRRCPQPMCNRSADRPPRLFDGGFCLVGTRGRTTLRTSGTTAPGTSGHSSRWSRPRTRGGPSRSSTGATRGRAGMVRVAATPRSSRLPGSATATSGWCSLSAVATRARRLITTTSTSSTSPLRSTAPSWRWRKRQRPRSDSAYTLSTHTPCRHVLQLSSTSKEMSTLGTDSFCA